MKAIKFSKIKEEVSPYIKYENNMEADREQSFEDNDDGKQDIHVENAQSWNYETHPEGIGPSYVVNNIDYNSETQLLTILLRDGSTFTYDNVERETVVDFVGADSKGRWWAAFTKNN
jgi:hypothetical protein